jgi:hypothetical protein
VDFFYFQRLRYLAESIKILERERGIMKRLHRQPLLIALALAAASILSTGCATKGQTGAIAGSGVGALVGQAIGGSTEATLIGAAVGTGVGYIIGNEMDKKHAQEMSRQTSSLGYDHNEVAPLDGTRWKIVDLKAPADRLPVFTSKIVEFGPKGHVKTTTTHSDGTVEVQEETYRVVGNTLIINKPGYLINAKFGIFDDQMIVDAEDFRAVLERIP